MWTRFHFFLTNFATFTQFQIKIMTFKNIHLLRFGASEFWGWSDANDETWRDRDAQKTFSWWNMMRKYWRRKASVVIFPFSYENFQSIFFFCQKKYLIFLFLSSNWDTTIKLLRKEKHSHNNLSSHKPPRYSSIFNQKLLTENYEKNWLHYKINFKLIPSNYLNCIARTIVRLCVAFRDEIYFDFSRIFFKISKSFSYTHYERVFLQKWALFWHELFPIFSYLPYIQL